MAVVKSHHHRLSHRLRLTQVSSRKQEWDSAGSVINKLGRRVYLVRVAVVAVKPTQTCIKIIWGFHGLVNYYKVHWEILVEWLLC